MPGKDLPELRAIWQAAGRPGVVKFRHAVPRAGLNLTVKKAADFVHGEATAQVFAPAPKSEGKISSPQLNKRWQADLIDRLQKQNPRKERREPPGPCGHRHLQPLSVGRAFANEGARSSRRGLPKDPESGVRES